MPRELYAPGFCFAKTVFFAAPCPGRKEGKNMDSYSNNKTGKTIFPVVTIAGIGMLSAVAAVLQALQIVVPIVPPQILKFDFSDLPALIGAFAYGPFAGVLIELLKNLIHLITTSVNGYVGVLSNFLLGATFTGVAGLIYITKKSKMSALTGSLAGSAIMAILSFPFNYFIIFPLYYNFMGYPEAAVLGIYQAILPSIKSVPQALVIFNMPFTLVKGLVCTVITMLIYKPLSPLLKWKFKKQG
jgi:riboflavin transporter FmnP